MDVFAAISDERRIVADFLQNVTIEQSRTPSLCRGWTVHDVGAHLLMPLITPLPRVLLAMVRHRLNWDAANVDLTASVAKLSTAEIADGLQAHADSRFTPPRLGPEAPLTDLLVHGQDMRRPVGVGRRIPPDRQLVALDFLTGGSAGAVTPGARLTGLEFTSTDLDWRWGSGRVVSGPAEAIMMAIAGRGVALAELSGSGVAVLGARL